jgi:hypothetical protein
MMIPKVPIGIGAPNVLEVPLVSDPGGFDLTTATAVRFRVWRPDGIELAGGWAGAITATTATSGTASYSFTGTEALLLGVYTIAPQLTVPAGVVPCASVSFQGVRYA